jgi:hypothetical protein
MMAKRLADWLEQGRLKLFVSPNGYDPTRWPQLIVKSNAGELCRFSKETIFYCLIETNQVGRLFQTDANRIKDLGSMRNGWEVLPTNFFATPSSLQIFEYTPRSQRNFERDFDFCKNREASSLKIEDPYAFDNYSYEYVIQFIDKICDFLQNPPPALSLKTRFERGLDNNARKQKFTDYCKSLGIEAHVRFVERGFKQPDFHDRRIEFEFKPTQASGAKECYRVLLTGGISRYMDAGYESAVVVRKI